MVSLEPVIPCCLTPPLARSESGSCSQASEAGMATVSHSDGPGSDAEAALEEWDAEENNSRVTLVQNFCGGSLWNQAPKTDDEELREAFAILDRNGNGVLSLRELRELLTTRGDKLTDAEVNEVMRAADTDRDGVISLDEFMNLMRLS
mmetsp:Transcript_50122/g.160365  ORF Transcript_50122/g.160365 Transcript_50122/m.160365 type:complete len:148 (-) Transcript_50122:135-578(-)